MQEKSHNNTNRTRRTRPRRRKAFDNYLPPFPKEVLIRPVDELKLNLIDTLDLLKSGGIRTFGDVLKREEKDFYKIYTFKKRNLFDVKDALKQLNLHLKPTEKVAEKKNDEGMQPPSRNRKNERMQPLSRNERNERRQPLSRNKKPVVNDAPPQDIYTKVSKSGKWGFSDNNKIVIPPQYDEVFGFREELCCVEKDGLFGFIDREGNIVVPIEYQCALSFSNGFACVYKGDKCGYINSNNEVVVDFLFDAATAVENGNCRVKRDGKWGELWLERPNEIRWIN